MTDDEIKALKALADAASPGPWAHWVDDRCPDDVRVCVNKDCSCHWCVALAGETVDGTVWTPETLARWRSDATFIAASREAVPDLIAEVERLTAERDQARRDAVCVLQLSDQQLSLAQGDGTRCRIEQYEAANESAFWQQITRLTTERDQARKDAVALYQFYPLQLNSIAHDAWPGLRERIRQYEADERAKGGGRG